MGRWVENPNSIKLISQRIVKQEVPIKSTVKRYRRLKANGEFIRDNPPEEIDRLPKVGDCRNYWHISNDFWKKFENDVFDTGWFDFTGDCHSKEEFIELFNKWKQRLDFSLDKNVFRKYVFEKIIEHYDFSFLD